MKNGLGANHSRYCFFLCIGKGNYIFANFSPKQETDQECGPDFLVLHSKNSSTLTSDFHFFKQVNFLSFLYNLK